MTEFDTLFQDWDSVFIRDGDRERPAAAGRSGVDFTVQLDVPWNSPEAFVTMDSAGLHELDIESMPNVLGLRARKPGVSVIRLMTGRDSRSVRALVPDGKVLDRGYHDVTLVDMNHEVPVTELDTLRLMWPVPVVSGMSDLQFELERRRRACKQRFRGNSVGFVHILWEDNQAGHGSACGKLSSRPSPTMALPSVVVYTVEGDASRLCRTPPSSTCSASYREGANLGKWFPQWTVSREMWRKALQPHVSRVSMDISLFSERGVPLIHHYRVFGGESVHNSLRGNYMIRLRAFAAQAEAEALWARHQNSACPAATATSAHPREVRQRDADVDHPRRKSRRAVSPRKS